MVSETDTGHCGVPGRGLLGRWSHRAGVTHPAKRWVPLLGRGCSIGKGLEHRELWTGWWWVDDSCWDLPHRALRWEELGASGKEHSLPTSDHGLKAEEGDRDRGWGGCALTLAQIQALARTGQVLARWVLGPLETGQHG